MTEAIDDPLRALALTYLPVAARAGVAALFALDGALGDILRTTSEPMVGRVRLAWWREALERLDSAPPPAQPVLEMLAAEAIGRHGVTGARLAAMVEGWEWLLEAPLGVMAARMHARARGELFVLAAALCGTADDDRARRAGRGWALADLAANLSDAALAARARAKAALLLRPGRGAWPRGSRALGALALIARADMEGRRGAGLVARLAWFRLTGR